jgi:uncharacterized protein (TIGR03545 family)
MKIFRWKAIVPLVLCLALVAVAWTLYVDVAIRRAIEIVGTEVVGAKVELASARFRLLKTDLVLRGLQVTDPDRPMTNLVELDEIVADLNGVALLEKKAVIETLAVRHVRFGTPRRSSGAIAKPSPTTGLVTRRVLDWSRSIPVPELSLGSLVGTAVRLPAISADSLRTLRQARAVIARGDSLGTAWEGEVRALNPQPAADSARALAERLRGADLRRLGVTGTRDAVTQARAAIAQVTQLKARLQALQADVAAGVTSVRDSVAALDAARRADYAFARGLINIPSFAAPDVSAALFGEMAKARLAPILYWANLAEEYAPAGLKPRERPGPTRVRRAGTTYEFPRERSYPQFLLERGEADLVVGGTNVASGAYRAWVRGATSEPAVYGRPLRFAAERTAQAGLRELAVGGSADRTGAVPRDSVAARVGGVSLPEVALNAVGARLVLGVGTVSLSLQRSGDALAGWWRLEADSVRWARTGDSTPAAPRPGTREWAEDLVWRAVSALRHVTIEAQLSGAVTGPRFTLSSNVGDEVSASLRRALGAEIERAEREVRAEVDRQVDAQAAQARARLARLESGVQARVAGYQEQLGQAQAELEQRLRDLTQVVPGVRLPGVRIPRPS